MDQRTGPSADVITIVAEPGALIFATRKEWQELPECCLGELAQHETVFIFYGTSSIYFLFRNINPADFLADRNAYKLVKVSIDEETGKQVFFIMNLSRAEAEQLRRNRLTLWE